MLRLILPDGKPLTWYLDQEQAIAENIADYDGESVFFDWRVSPTVIYGRHQVVENEVNLAYCRQHGIEVVQRKSGGGCVYADRGNRMLSLISPNTHSQEVFEAFMRMVAGWLQAQGFDAVTTERNDILIGGKKVSGSACYSTPHATIVHATMMERVNLEHLENAIRPPAEKLDRHGVESVRQRVMNLNTELIIGVC